VVALPGVQASAAAGTGPSHRGRAARLRARPELHLGATDECAGAAEDHHDDHSDHYSYYDSDSYYDSGHDADHHADGINHAERHRDQRFADHGTDDHRAAATRRADVVALIGCARPRAVAEPVALTGADLNHRYTGVP
jgi:hypothetical protein